jgi:hypothetical protein
MDHINLIYTYLVISLFVTHIPVVGAYVALANTLVHELGHALLAKAFGGRVHSISLHHDTSGLATTSTVNFWLVKVLVSYAGYTVSSLTSIGLFYMLSKAYYTYIIYIFILVGIVSVLLWVRNFIGFIWGVSFISILGFLVYKDLSVVLVHMSIFLSCVLLVQSVSTAFVILRLSLSQPHDAGDATSLARATYIIPAFVWGFIFFAQSLLAGYYIFDTYILYA